jgi:hypothetical protein
VEWLTTRFLLAFTHLSSFSDLTFHYLVRCPVTRWTKPTPTDLEVLNTVRTVCYISNIRDGISNPIEKTEVCPRCTCFVFYRRRITKCWSPIERFLKECIGNNTERLCIMRTVCVKVCDELLPPGVNPITVKYIYIYIYISYHIKTWSSWQYWLVAN